MERAMRWKEGLRTFRMATGATDARAWLSRDGIPQAPRYDAVASKLARLGLALLDRSTLSMGEIFLRANLDEQGITDALREAYDHGFGKLFELHSVIHQPHTVRLANYATLIENGGNPFTVTHVSLDTRQSQPLKQRILDELAEAAERDAGLQPEEGAQQSSS